MTIRSLTAAELLAFVDSPAYATLPQVPISPLRARAQAHNPAARPTDPLLWLAYAADERLLGYLGTLPAEVSGHHAAWLSCIWTSPAARGQGVARALVQAAYAAYDGKLLLTEFTGPARRLYDRSGLFRLLRHQPGMRYYFRSALADLLPARHPIFARLQPLLAGVDQLANAPLELARVLKRRAALPAGWQIVPAFTPELTAWIAARQSGELFPRSAEALRWIKDFPWVFTDEDTEQLASRYAFTARARQYAAPLLVLRTPFGELRAVLLLRRKDRELKLIAAYFDPAVAATVAELIWHYCRHERIAYLTLYDPRLLPYLTGRGLPNRRRVRTYYQSDRLVQVLGSPATGSIQDGDGDVFGV